MGEDNNVLLLYVAMTSRKRDTPLSVLILSSSRGRQDGACKTPSWPSARRKTWSS